MPTNSMSDPKRPIREIMRHYDHMVHVDNALPGYHYAWESVGANHSFINESLMLGYERVQGDDPECRHFKESTPEGYRKCGDVILMRISMDRYKEIKTYRIEMQTRNSGRVQDEAFIERLRQKGVNGFNFREISELKTLLGIGD